MCSNDEHRSRGTDFRLRFRLEKLRVVDMVKKFHPPLWITKSTTLLAYGPNAKLWLGRHFRKPLKSVYYLYHVRRSSACIRAVLTGRISMKFDFRYF